MDQNREPYEEEVEVNLFDLWVFFLRKLWLVVLALVIFAALLGGGKLWSNLRQEPRPAMTAEEIESAELTMAKNEKSIETLTEFLEDDEARLETLNSNREWYEQLLIQAESIDPGDADGWQQTQVLTLMLDINEKIISIEEESEETVRDIRENQAEILSLEEENAELAAQMEETVSVSRRSGVVRYGVLGAVLGVCIAVVYIVLRYCFDRTLRGEREIAVRFGVPVAGTLRFPLADGRRHGRHGRVRRWLDRMSGDSPDGPPEEQYKLAASKIQLLCGECSTLMVTGTLPQETLEQFCQKVGACLPEGYRVTALANPLIDSESVLRVKECPVLLLEKVHTSKVSEIRNLLSFLRLSGASCPGAMVLREGAGNACV